MTAKEVAVALNGRPVGHHYLCRCPVPGHGQGRGDRHPSLLVRMAMLPGVYSFIVSQAAIREMFSRSCAEKG